MIRAYSAITLSYDYFPYRNYRPNHQTNQISIGYTLSVITPQYIIAINTRSRRPPKKLVYVERKNLNKTFTYAFCSFFFYLFN